MDLPLKIERDTITQKLSERKAQAACPSCGNNNWAFPQEAAQLPQWSNVFPAPGIPTVVMICNNCGYIRLHALAPLGLIPKENEGAKNESK